MNNTYGSTGAAEVLNSIVESSDKKTRRKVGRTLSEFHRMLHKLRYIGCSKTEKKLAFLVYSDCENSIESNSIQFGDEHVKNFTLNFVYSSYKQFIRQIDTTYQKKK